MTFEQWIILALVPTGYLLGAIPTGLLVGLAKGIDPRTRGSGNIGASNMGRIFGFRWFLVVFFGDMLKGLIPTGAVGVILWKTVPDAATCGLWVGVALAVLLGNMYSVFMGFKGGKGVATSFGVVLGIFPYLLLPLAIAAVTWGVMFASLRYMSVASMVGSWALVPGMLLSAWLMDWPVSQLWPLVALAVVSAALVTWRHRSNIERLIKGEEPKMQFGSKRESA